MNIKWKALKGPYKKRARHVSLFGKLAAGNVALVVFMLLLTLSVTMNRNIATMEKQVDDTLMNTATSLMRNSLVIKAATGELNTEDRIELGNFLDHVIAVNDDISVIIIADASSVQLYHPLRIQIGLPFEGGDQHDALRGKKYFSETAVDANYQRRAFAPILSEYGKPLGFVMVSTMIDRLEQIRDEVYTLYFNMGILLLLVGFTSSFVLSVSIKRSLLGLEPSKISADFLTREEILNSLEEGVISTNTQTEIMLLNRSAAEMLDVTPEKALGRRLEEVLPMVRLDEMPDAGKAQYNLELAAAGATILYDKVPIIEHGSKIGVVLILRNKTEATRLAEQLTGTRHIITALRANTHEFMNKLHVILGLLQMGKTEDAKMYIQQVSNMQSESISPVLQYIKNPTIAALILGKISHMRELDIDLTLLHNSALPYHSRYLPTRSLVTVVGNLLENAIEAINARTDDSPRRITLQITETEDGLLIGCDDTGVGIEPENLTRIFEPGMSTKGDGRGTGMTLITDVLDTFHGDIQVDSEPGVGTSIQVSVRHERTKK